MTYAEKLRDPRWQKKRLEILQRDGFKCRDCESDAKTLHVHHSHYDAPAPWHTHSDLLITVCDDCQLESDAKRNLDFLMTKMSRDRLWCFVQALTEASNTDGYVPMITDERLVEELWEKSQKTETRHGR